MFFVHNFTKKESNNESKTSKASNHQSNFRAKRATESKTSQHIARYYEIILVFVAYITYKITGKRWVWVGVTECRRGVARMRKTVFTIS